MKNKGIAPITNIIDTTKTGFRPTLTVAVTIKGVMMFPMPLIAYIVPDPLDFILSGKDSV